MCHFLVLSVGDMWRLPTGCPTDVTYDVGELDIYGVAQWGLHMFDNLSGA